MNPFNSQRAPVLAKNGMACSSQPLAAAVGRDILKAGGNAADAAVAMAAMVNITEPMMNGLGGDSMMLVHWNGAFFGLNGSGRSGSRLTIDNLCAAGFSSMPKAGAATVSVPGALDAYLALRDRFGSMDLSALVEPCGSLCRGWLCREGEGKPGVEVGRQIFQHKDLARTWRSIARGGRAALHGGEVRDRILGALQKTGGYLEIEDFDQVQAEWVEPIRASYRGHTILELPPNGQGIVALMALGILEGFDLTGLFNENEAQARSSRPSSCALPMRQGTSPILTS